MRTRAVIQVGCTAGARTAPGQHIPQHEHRRAQLLRVLGTHGQHYLRQEHASKACRSDVCLSTHSHLLLEADAGRPTRRSTTRQQHVHPSSWPTGPTDMVTTGSVATLRGAVWRRGFPGSLHRFKRSDARTLPRPTRRGTILAHSVSSFRPTSRWRRAYLRPLWWD